MRSLSELREHPNFQRLKDSVEFKSQKRTLLVISIFFLLFLLLLIGTSGSAYAQYKNLFYWFMYIFFFFPCVVYTFYRTAKIFFHIDCYSFTEAVLDRPKQGVRGAMYFTVTLRDRSGREFEADTNQIFSRGTPNFEEYMNQKALIGYNEKTELVVVIKRLP